jgi:hypothetical protein
MPVGVKLVSWSIFDMTLTSVVITNSSARFYSAAAGSVDGKASTCQVCNWIRVLKAQYLRIVLHKGNQFLRVVLVRHAELDNVLRV